MGSVTVDVNVGTLRNVEEILREASVPVSRYYILRQLAKKGAGTTQVRLNVALAYLFERKMAMEGSKGIQWTHSASPSLRRAVVSGRRV